MDITKYLLSDEQLEQDIQKDYPTFLIKNEDGRIADILCWTREAQLRHALPLIVEDIRKDLFEHSTAQETDFPPKILSITMKVSDWNKFWERWI